MKAKMTTPAQTKSVTLGVKIDPTMLAQIDAFAANANPALTRFEAVRALVKLGFEADRRKQLLDRKSSAEARKVEMAQATAEYAAAQITEEAKTARLKRARLEKEQAERRTAG